MRKQLLISLLLLAPAGAALAAQQSGAVPCQPKHEAIWNCVLHDVSILRLLADPTAFDGKRVRTVAWLELTDDGASAFLQREDQQAKLLRHALRLKDMPASTCRSGHYVTLEGVFHLPDTTRREPAAHDNCLSCAQAEPDADWLLPVGGMLDVLRCMPRP